MADETIPSKKPTVSVVIEGFNESCSLGSTQDTLHALKQQDFPLDQVEVVLVGSSAQVENWKTLHSASTPFFAVKTVEAEGVSYPELKNSGARCAAGDVVAFTDSDVYPRTTWLTSLVESIRNGADVSVGPSLYKGSNGYGSDTALSQVLSSITWGWIVGKNTNGKSLQPAGFHAHNVAFRADAFRRHQFWTKLGRTCGSTLLYRTLTDGGATIVLQPKQQAVHYFSWGFFAKIHFRNGHHVFRLRRVDKGYPNQWIARTTIFEPLVTMGWHMLLDIPRWFRFSKLLDLNVSRRVTLLPLLMALSLGAHACEAAGMYATLLAHNAMNRWTESA